MTTPRDPNAPATEPDTTVGGGNPLPPATQQPYEVDPDEVQGVPESTATGAAERQTDSYSGGTSASGIGRVGDTDAGVHNPNANIGDTTVAGGGQGGIGQVGDTDTHARDPRTGVQDTTVGGGGIGSTAAPAYRAPSADAPATQKDTTTTFGGTGGEAAGSPDTATVGTGVNPNAAEPGLTNSAYNVGGTKDTTYLGSTVGGNAPVNDGTPTAAPTNVTATLEPSETAVLVSWTPPANAGATKVTRYVVESNTQGTQQAPANATSVEFDQGLIPGQTYTFTVYAETTQGSGRRSAPSAPVTMPSLRNLGADTTRADGL